MTSYLVLGIFVISPVAVTITACQFSIFLQCFDTVGWVTGRASDL